MTDSPRLPDALIAEIVRRVTDLPDRTSPDDWPEAMLVTGDELQQIITAVLADRAVDATDTITRDGWDCARCGHRHAGLALANICVGCPCEETAPDTAEEDWIRIASQNARDATARLEATKQELAALQAEADQARRYLAILADHAITEPDTLKHRLEDWERWNAERQDGQP